MLILSYENEISFTCKLNSFSYEWLCTRPRFGREALGNSEMVYFVMFAEKNLVNAQFLLDSMKSFVPSIVCLFFLNVGFQTEAEGML